MSLINQVLKDLEQRHAEQLVEATHSLDGLAFTPQAANKSARRRWRLPGLFIMLVVAAVLAYWSWSQHFNALPPASVATQPVIQPAPAVSQEQVSQDEEIKPAPDKAPVNEQRNETRVAEVKPAEKNLFGSRSKVL